MKALILEEYNKLVLQDVLVLPLQLIVTREITLNGSCA